MIPNMVTIDGVVNDAGNFPMPEDCIRPIINTWVKECKDGTPLCFPLGILDRQQAYQTIICPQPPEGPEPSDCTPVEFYNYGGLNREFLVYSNWYYENYGKRQERFFGYVTYNVENNRLEFTGGPPAGEKVLITYRSDNSEAKVIPMDAVAMVRNFTLYRHWLSSDRFTAMEYWRQFKIAIRMFKRSRLSGYRYEDYLDSFTREYKFAIGP